MTANRLKKAVKRILALLMAAIVLLTMAPDTVEAYIGAIREINETDPKEALRTGTFDYDGMKYMYIENDYIHFDICVDGAVFPLGATSVGVKGHTLPTAAITRDKDGNPVDLDKFGYQLFDHMVAEDCAGGNVEFSSLSVLNLAKYSAKGVPGFVSDEVLGNKCISVTPNCFQMSKYRAFSKLSNLLNAKPDYNITTYFTLVKLDSGSIGEGFFPSSLNIAPNDKSQNWGVRVRSVCNETDPDHSGRDKFKNDYYRLNMRYVGFPTTGHNGIRLNARVGLQTVDYSNYVPGQGYGCNYLPDISEGLSQTGSNTVLEVGSYGFKNSTPFVAASDMYRFRQILDLGEAGGGVYGHNSWYPESIEYASNGLLKTYGAYDNDISGGGTGSSCALWGFRDISASKQSEEEFNEVTVEGNDYIYVVDKTITKGGRGSGKSVRKRVVGRCSSIEDVPSDAFACYRGTYVDTGASYRFIDGAVALSPTITMSWDKEQEGEGTGQICVKLNKNDGTLSFPADKVTLKTPTFDFYKPKPDATSDALTFKDYNAFDFDAGMSRKGIVFNIDPAQNDAIVNITLPGNEISVKSAAVEKDGSLEFSGKLSIDLFLAECDMQALKMRKKQNSDSMTLDGIKASGKLTAPSSELDFKIFNLSGSEISADIDTYGDDKHYNFDFKLSVREMFSTQAVLNLKELDNGELCPDKIYFEFESTKDGAGIAISPAVTLTGGGGGVDHLADQIQKSYISVPCVTVQITGIGRVVEVIHGKLTLDVGPTKLSLNANDVGFKIKDYTKISIIEGLGAGFEFNDFKKTYNDIDYLGYKFGGSMWFNIGIIPETYCKEWYQKLFKDAITANANIQANVMVAENQDKGMQYDCLELKGDGGCSINLPFGLGELVRGDLYTSIRGEGAGPRNSNPFNNMELKGGIAATGKCALGWGRAMYIIPDKFEAEKHLFSYTIKPVPFANASPVADGMPELEDGMSYISEPIPVTLEDGTEALALFASNLYLIDADVEETANTAAEYDSVTVAVPEEEALGAPAGIAEDIEMLGEPAEDEVSIDKAGSTSKNIKIAPADLSGIADDQGVVVMVIPKDQADLDAVFNSISVTGLKDNFNIIKPVCETVGSDVFITNNEELNVWRGAYEISESGNKNCVYVSIYKNQFNDDGKFTISADAGFDIAVSASAPVTGLSGSLSSNNLNLKIDNPVQGAAYNLDTYYGTKDENGDVLHEYLVDSHEGVNTGAASIVLPLKGEEIPTGSYYVTTMLTDSEGLPIASFVSDDTISYTNTFAPTAPETVTLTPSGNESLLGTWSDVTYDRNNMAQVAGYKLSIYENRNGVFTDTGRGYDYTSEELAKLTDNDPNNDPLGMSYDKVNKEYNINMAITVNGDPISEFGGSGGIGRLEPGKEYKLGVRAYSAREVKTIDENGNDTTVHVPIYSTENQSDAQLLAKYEPVSFAVSVGNKAVTRNSESNMYEYVGNAERKSVSFSNFRTSTGADVSDMVDVKVTYTDANGNEKSLTNIANSFTLPDFSGVLRLRVDAAYNHDGMSDVTTEYVKIEKDDIAPVIILDDDVVKTDDAGAYTVTGTTEAGMDIYVDGNKKTTADAEGAFKLTGSIADDTVFLAIKAVDAAGNESDTVVAAVTKPVKRPPEEESLIDDTNGEYTPDQIKDLVIETVTDEDGTVRTVTKLWIGGLKDSYRYTGEQIKPAIHVYDGLTRLTEGTDYVLGYSNNVKVSDTTKKNGKAQLTVAFIGNYKTKKSVSFEIEPAVLGNIGEKDDSNVNVIAEDVFVVSTGRYQKPVPVVSFRSDGRVINKNGFVYTYKDADGNEVPAVKDEGVYTVTVTPKKGNNNFTGSATANITVVPKEEKGMLLSSAKVKFKQGKYLFTGSAIEPGSDKYVVKLGKKVLTAGSDFTVRFKDNIEPGIATMILTATDNSEYYGSVSCKFKIINGKTLLTQGATGSTFTYEWDKSMPFAMSGAKPTVKVMDGTKVLAEGIDYKLKYWGNTRIAAADAKDKKGKDIAPGVYVIGMGRYNGCVKLNFGVTKQNIANTAIFADDKVESNKGYKNPKITITDADGKVLKHGRDYEIAGYQIVGTTKSVADVGDKIAVTIKGKGCYEGTKSVEYYYISASSHLKNVKAAKIAPKYYTGSEIRLTNTELNTLLCKVTSDGKTYLVPGTDFDVSYVGNVKPGTGYVILRGKAPKYGGTIMIPFKIGTKNDSCLGALIRGMFR
ncbi:MAG: hypothetical protein IK111_09570 [Lachnospiraceae bacterium]|nr:hypothetical protein [Lachnospiraceae bacterium]